MTVLWLRVHRNHKGCLQWYGFWKIQCVFQLKIDTAARATQSVVIGISYALADPRARELKERFSVRRNHKTEILRVADGPPCA
jgi:hypothetical protein